MAKKNRDGDEVNIINVHNVSHMKAHQYSAGVEIDPEFNSKGQYKSGIKIWVSSEGFNDGEEAIKWLDKAVSNLTVKAIAKINELKVVASQT